MRAAGRHSGVWLVLGCALVAGCDQPAEPDRPVAVRVTGVVVARPDGFAVAGAVLTLGRGGHFTLPAELASTQSDASGRFMIDHVIWMPGNPSNSLAPCGLWVRAQAQGFVTSTNHDVKCETGVQNIQIDLLRAP
jgi:hypothetical protein